MNYIIGKIVYINNNYVIIENSFIGYLVFITNPEEYEINKYKKLFICEKNSIQRNYLIKELYGFINFKSKILFEKLVKINGIGPKIAMQILTFGTDKIKEWIINQDFDSFKMVKGLSLKSINLIFNEIKIDLSKKDNDKNQNFEEAIEALKSLGYSKEQIQKSVNLIQKEKLEINEENNLSSLIASLIKNINEHQTT